MVQSTPPLAEFSLTNLLSAKAENPGSNVEVSGQEYDLTGNFARKSISLVSLIIGGHYKYTRYEVDNLNACL